MPATAERLIDAIDSGKLTAEFSPTIVRHRRVMTIFIEKQEIVKFSCVEDETPIASLGGISNVDVFPDQHGGPGGFSIPCQDRRLAMSTVQALNEFFRIACSEK